MLNDMLIQKEKKVSFVSHLIHHSQQVVVVARLNIPGKDKAPLWSHPIFNACVASIEASFLLNKWAYQRVENVLIDAYYEQMAVFCVNSEAVKIKAAMLHIEETHDFGRIFDLDVNDTSGESLDRKSMNLNPRKCYLCNEDAYVCARSKAHETEELIDFLILKAKMLLDK